MVQKAFESGFQTGERKGFGAGWFLGAGGCVDGGLGFGAGLAPGAGGGLFRPSASQGGGPAGSFGMPAELLLLLLMKLTSGLAFLASMGGPLAVNFSSGPGRACTGPADAGSAAAAAAAAAAACSSAGSLFLTSHKSDTCIHV